MASEKICSLTIVGCAIGLSCFLFRSSVCIAEEYTPLYLKQLGYNTLYIGLAPSLGLFTQTLGIPSLSYLADKFRARKLFLFLAITISLPSTLLFFAASTPQPICDVITGNPTAGNDFIVSSLDTTNNLTDLPSLSTMKTFNHTQVPTQRLTKGQDENKNRLSFFIIFMMLRGIFELSKRLSLTLITVAMINHEPVKQNRLKFGHYACWGEIGAGLALFLVGITMQYVQHNVCGNLAPHYAITFFFVVGLQFLTLGTLPFLKFEYLEHKVIDYKEVKRVLTNPHYILVLIISCHCGMCAAFQSRWEFWYMEKLGGTPIAMAVGGLLRRPTVAVWYLLSRFIVGRLGELCVIAISLFIFAVSFLALGFIQNAWLVILLDNFQAASYILSFTSIVIHLSKAGSEASTAFFQGVVSVTFHGIGKEIGMVLTGYLFLSIGTSITLHCYAAATTLLLVILLIYMLTGENLEGYSKIPQTELEQKVEVKK